MFNSTVIGTSIYSRLCLNSSIDYNFHLIVADPTEEALRVELPRVIAGGCTSLKFFTVYDDVMLKDRQLLQASPSG